MNLAELRIQHWDAVSRKRALSDMESLELERAIRLLQRYEIRAQATPPPPSKRRARA